MLPAGTFVVVLAVTISLINIYFFPAAVHQVNITRNVIDEDNDFEMHILLGTEKLSFNSSLFTSLDRETILSQSPANAILNISLMIELVNNKSSALHNLIQGHPERSTLDYNGTLFNTDQDVEYYLDLIFELFSDSVTSTYLSFYNSTISSYTAYSIFSETESDISVELITESLQLIFSNSSAQYTIIHTIDYYESYGIFQEFSTSFQRIIFTDGQGDILFFLSNEGRIN